MQLITATAEHIEPLLADFPERSAVELAELFDTVPRDALTRALASSTESWTLMSNSGPVAMFGVAPLSVFDGTGIIWFMAAQSICRQRLAFAKATKRVVQVIFRHYATLQNIIDPRHADVVKWVQWLGAELTPIDACASKMILRRGT